MKLGLPVPRVAVQSYRHVQIIYGHLQTCSNILGSLILVLTLLWPSAAQCSLQGGKKSIEAVDLWEFINT